MQMFVQVKSNYGNEAIYPACEISQGFAELLKQKTFTRMDIQRIQRIGFEIKNRPIDYSFNQRSIA
jgi:hypothetical protein